MTVTIVCGPPCAGKTTHALRHAAPGDLIVDHDLIAQQLGSPSTHAHTQGIRNAAERQVRAHLRDIQAGAHPTAWVVRTLGLPARRTQLAQQLRANVLLIDPGIETCTARAQRRPHPETTIHAIHRWYAQAQHQP